MQEKDFLGLMNIVMQLKKVCNHPDLFEPRTIETPYLCQPLRLVVWSHFLLNLHKLQIPNGFNLLQNELQGYSSYNIAHAKSSILTMSYKQIEDAVDMLYQNLYTNIPFFALRWRDQMRNNRIKSIQNILEFN